MKGRLLDLKRMCVHDGPGIRTTVFLKGCPLRCGWCHNPEGLRVEPEIGYFQAKCRLCGRCAQVCPHGAQVVFAGRHEFEREKCRGCGRCVTVCPVEALELYGREATAESVVASVLEDRTFYAQSGGGVTLSGGEPLMQAEFCAEVFRRLRAEGVHCALETSGAVDWERFALVRPQTDLFLFDVKHVDGARHRAGTGGASARILANLSRLAETGAQIEVRVPLIPGFNADVASLEAIGRFLLGLPRLSGVRLLPYHLARRKYAVVGHEDAWPAVEPPTPEQVACAHSVFQALGLLVA